MTLQPAAVMPADVEGIVVAHLKTWLADRPESFTHSAWVGRRKPTTNARQIAVRRDGGPVIGLFDLPRLTIRCWDADADVAMDLGRLVVGALKVLPLHDPMCVAATEVLGPSPIPDQSQPQVMVNAELRIRCTPL